MSSRLEMSGREVVDRNIRHAGKQYLIIKGPI